MRRRVLLLATASVLALFASAAAPVVGRPLAVSLVESARHAVNRHDSAGDGVVDALYGSPALDMGAFERPAAGPGTPMPTLTPTHAPTATSGADILTFIPSDDSYVQQDYPNSKFGSATALQVDNSPKKDFLLKFSVSGIGSRYVTSAKIRLVNTNASSKGGDFHRAADTSWSEGTVTWNNAPAADPAVVASLGTVAIGNTYDVDVTSAVTSDGVVSFRVTSTSSDTAGYYSKEGANPLQLIVQVSGTQTPLPTPTPTPTATPTRTAGDPVLVGAGDITYCSNPARSESTAKLLDAIPGTVFVDGDASNDDGTLAQYQNCYGPSWGRHLARTNPVPAAHDFRTNDTNYYTYFGAAAHGPNGYYSYDLGTWHIIAMNSECTGTGNAGGCGANDPEGLWLQADLAAHPNTCTLVYWHIPRFSTGVTHGSNTTYTAWWQILYNNHVDLVVNGHDHDYERFAPQTPNGVADPVNGIREFVVGTGGAGPRATTNPFLPTTEVRNSDTLGVIKFTLHPTSYDWEFVPVAGKTFTDSGSAACHFSGPTPVGGIAEPPPFEANSGPGGHGSSRAISMALAAAAGGALALAAGGWYARRRRRAG